MCVLEVWHVKYRQKNELLRVMEVVKCSILKWFSYLKKLGKNEMTEKVYTYMIG